MLPDSDISMISPQSRSGLRLPPPFVRKPHDFQGMMARAATDASRANYAARPSGPEVITVTGAAGPPRGPAWAGSPSGAKDLDVEVADLLAQRVAVDAQEIGGADLVAAGRGKRC